MSKQTSDVLRALLVCLAVSWAGASFAQPASPRVGEPVNGFPNWSERLLLELTNRARADPQQALIGCPGGNCSEKACYLPIGPLYFHDALTRAARFHDDEMFHQSYFDHDSHCVLANDIGTTYPGTCDGSAGCGCAGAGTTSAAARVQLFGVAGGGAEVLAGGADAPGSLEAWLYEDNSPSTTCAYSPANGHRWLLLKSTGSVGFGVSNDYAGGDFVPIAGAGKMPSGAHTPQAGPGVDFYVNWSDSAAPVAASVDVNGVCTGLRLDRGTSTNGAYTAHIAGLGACERYFFSMTDSTGHVLTYPTTGSYGIGLTGSCPDWTLTRPAACSSVSGDSNGDGALSVLDVFTLINYLFAGGATPVSSGDVNGDHQISVLDVFYLINYLFAGGPAPL